MDVELNRAESELQAEEASLHAELTRLASVSGELSQRVGQLYQEATVAGAAEIAQRARIEVPAVNAGGAFERAKAARLAAVQARRETNAAVRQQVSAAKTQLQRLAQQVLADEKALVAVKAEAAAAARVAAAVAPPPPSPRATPIGKIVPRPAPEVLKARAANPAAQRQSPRVRMQAAVDFSSDNNFYNGFSANISDGGLFVATVNLQPLGTEIDLAFSLPSGERIEAKGVVRWVREINDQIPDSFPGIGIQFKQLSPDAEQAIHHFLAEREPLFYAE
ncbi:MAG: TIGR02266 family protein [Myxococcota bacterium]